MDVIRPTVMALGYELWGCEYLSQGKHSLLRIYIEKETGVSLDDCQKASEQISAVLDVEDSIRSHYTVEISSPGVQRILFTQEQMKRYLGDDVKVRMREPIDGRRKFVGKLQDVQESNVIISSDTENIVLPITQIDKMNLL